MTAATRRPRTDVRIISEEPLPPDHPLFTQGIGFVFKQDLPEDDERDEEAPADEDSE
jgi:hypothetical protein